MSWAERAADRSPIVQRSRSRSVAQAKRIVEAARRLGEAKGDSFTTQEVVKEAGVALQTFYRHFGGKDQLILAVIEDMIAESCQEYQERARKLPGPLERLRFYLTVATYSLDSDQTAGSRLITGEHWRLHQVFPEELARATKPFADLVLDEIRAAEAEGLLAPRDAERDAWLVTKLVMAVYHHYAYAEADRPPAEVAEHLWQFCLPALRPTPAAGTTPSLDGEAPLHGGTPP